MRIIIVSANASVEFGGESMLPWNYFRILYERGYDVHLVTHERVKSNLIKLLPSAKSQMHFVPDRAINRIIGLASSKFPRAIKEMIFWPLSALFSMPDLYCEVKKLSTGRENCVIHEPAPVSPRMPSAMRAYRAQLVIGPLNGGMHFPPAFQTRSQRGRLFIKSFLKFGSIFGNILIRGKLNADLLIVANKRTLSALTFKPKKELRFLCENGVDLNIFKDANVEYDKFKFVYVGRLIDWKMVDILIHAIGALPKEFHLQIIGDGPKRIELENLAHSLNISHRVHFEGFLDQAGCATALSKACGLLLPSVHECGGAVVLEAMAAGKVVIATNWGGPADYISHGVDGLLIEPISYQGMIESFANYIKKVADDEYLRQKLIQNSRIKVVSEFCWEKKVDTIVDLYEEIIEKEKLRVMSH